MPGWTEFFSPEFIAISPNNEYELAEKECLFLFDSYITATKAFDRNDKFLSSKDTQLHIEGQNKYSLGQRKNSKTQKALAKYIGEEASREFIENVLFPVFQ